MGHSAAPRADGKGAATVRPQPRPCARRRALSLGGTTGRAISRVRPGRPFTIGGAAGGGRDRGAPAVPARPGRSRGPPRGGGGGGAGGGGGGAAGGRGGRRRAGG